MIVTDEEMDYNIVDFINNFFVVIKKPNNYYYDLDAIITH